MDRYVYRIRTEVLTAAEFRTEFDEIWSELAQDADQLRRLGLPPEAQGRPSAEYFRIEEGGPVAGFSGIEQVIVQALVSGAASAAVRWILDRIARGRPANAIEPTESGRSGPAPA